MRIEARSAIITGASSGLGAALARELSRAGVRVGLTARREAELQAIARSIRDEGGIAEVAPGDAADPASTRAAFARLIETLGPIDLLIANAGLGDDRPATVFSADAVDRMVRVNLIGAAYAIEAVLPTMLDRRRGRIVGISSLAAFRGLPGSASYSAGKAGLTTLLEGLRAELRAKGVGVTAVHPGFIRTPMTEGAGHRQPFLMEVEPAARIIVEGIARGARRIDFPAPMVGLLRLVQVMPGWLYDRIADRLVNGSRADSRIGTP